MAIRGSSLYSRFVVWAKIILPLTGLAILSSLFLFSGSNTRLNPQAVFDSDSENFTDRERISEPRFAGMTDGGVAIRLSAKEASPRQNDSGTFDASNLSGLVEFPDGRQIEVQATAGTVSSAQGFAALSGAIKLDTTDGFVAKTESMRFSLDRLDIECESQISATSPLGEITAGSMRLSSESIDSAGNEKGYLLVFKDRVKLVYKIK